MYIGDLEDLIHEAKVYPNIRFISSRWGEKQGAPGGSLTILVGDWTMTEKYGKPHLSPEHVAAFNVPYPFVPKYSVIDKEGMVAKRGYVGLLSEMLAMRIIRPTKKVRAALGGHWDKLKREHSLEEV